jgi:adhesin/invasin
MLYISAMIYSCRFYSLTGLIPGSLFFFLMVLAFIPPSCSRAEITDHLLSASYPTSYIRTVTYRMAEGETPELVARKYKMSLESLRKLNQFRTFAHGFDHLRYGDELEVPLVPLPTGSSDKRIIVQEQPYSDEQLQKVAATASQAGSFLARNPDGSKTSSIALEMLTNKASGQLQQLFSRFGTVRIQLDTVKTFSLKNSQVDLLAPLYDNRNAMSFAQGSLHSTDDRTQSNLGAGIRWFNNNWMVGGNSFIDYDFTGTHTRAGLGIEYWRDSMRLGINSYLRLSDWKETSNLSEYDARPANGWDIRVQTWLPSLPQLGGKLMFEQYYGKEVALFDRNNRQRDPYAITAGINYTPIPLLTFSVDQRQGVSGKKDVLLGISMNYRLGEPWRQQFDPAVVSTMRSLAGSRYDLVDRNNNIILEYRKKEVIHLQTTSLVTGYTGEQKSLNVSVTSTFGLARINWLAPSLLAAGGNIVQSGNSYSVVLPAWQPDSSEGNSFIVSGTAVDNKGNLSNKSETRVIVQAPDIDSTNSTFTPNNSTLPADGRSARVLTLIVKDRQNHSVDVAASAITLNTGQLKSAVVSELVRKSSGKYEVTVTAGRDNESVTISPEISGMKLPSATVLISSSASLPAQANSKISTDNTTYTSGSDMTLTVTLKDFLGNAVPEATNLLTSKTVTVPNAELKTGTRWIYDGEGAYTATYVTKSAGTSLKATLKLSDWSRSVESTEYEITTPAHVQGLSVNGYTYSNDAGFPATGFKGAKFTLELNNGSAADYIWGSDASWVSVNEGVVSFTGMGTGNKVTVTGTPKSGTYPVIKYSFTLKSWFLPQNYEDGAFTWSEATSYCGSTWGSAYHLPSIKQLAGNDNTNGVRGVIGGLWSEWGPLYYYSDSDMPALSTWTGSEFIVVNPTTGTVVKLGPNYGAWATCMKSL